MTDSTENPTHEQQVGNRGAENAVLDRVDPVTPAAPPRQRLHVIYRICALESPKPRPLWYSKLTCLKSLMNALDKLPDATLWIISDGDLPTYFPLDYFGLPRTELFRAKNKFVGNCESFLYSLHRALQYPDDDVVYFVEDDYLHLPMALVKLIESFEYGFSYATLYDHPARYDRSDLEDQRNPALECWNTHHWRTIESICMTFAARVGNLREDQDIIRLYLNGKYPQDRRMWHHIQGIGGFENPNPKRLWGAIPALATHCETAWLSPTIDWAKVAREVTCGA